MDRLRIGVKSNGDVHIEAPLSSRVTDEGLTPFSFDA